MNQDVELERLSPGAQDLLFARLRKGRGADPGRIVRRAERGDRVPLSFAQERLWFLDQMRPGDPAYNIYLALRLGGRLSVPVLAGSLEEVVRRHEALRTTFVQAGSEPVQHVAGPGPLPLPLIDLQGLAAEERRRSADEIAREESRAGFDLERGPLVRTRLLRLAADEHMLLLSLHHIVADGWSLGVLVREVAELYQALAGGRPASSLRPLAVQYADFALWQREWLSGSRLEQLVAHWRLRLENLPLLELPADRPRPAVQSSRGGEVRITLPPALLGRLKRHSDDAGATLFMTLLAAFQVLLHRYTGQTDLAVGAPIANRTRSEIEGLVGLFMNILVLRSDIGRNPAWRDLLRQVADTAVEAYAHQDLPFEKLVTELQPERSLSHNPLVGCLLALQNSPLDLTLGPELRLSAVGLHNGTAKLDLYLSFWENDEGLLGQVEYSRDLFDGASIERLLGHYANLLRGVLDGAGAPISDLPLLAPGERAQLLIAANDTRAPFRAAPVHRLFEEQAARTPELTALICGSERLTYAELDARASRIAHHLLACGAGPEALVGLCLERSADLVAGLLGILKSGAAYVPLDSGYPAERLRFMAEDARLALLLTSGAAAPDPPLPGLRTVDLDAAREELARRSPEAPRGETDPDGLAYVIYTSGSTGRPKGVMVTHRNVANFLAGMDDCLPGPPGTLLALTSVSFDISVLELLWTLTRGFTVVLRGAAPAAQAAVDAPATCEVELSLFYFASDEEGSAGDGYRLLLEGARFADRAGLRAVWTPERHFHAFGGLYPNPSVTSAAIAAVTERVQIRAGSVVLPLHHPVRVAEEWSVVDNLSRGRVGISFASGWHAQDFALAPQSYEDRKEILLRDLETVRRLWRGEACRLPAVGGGEVEVRIRPRPVQPELPVWLTAAGNPETFRIAGEIGANVLTHLLGQSLQELEGKIAVYRDAWRRSGWPGEGHVTLMLHTFLGTDPEQVRQTVRGPFTAYLSSSVDLMRRIATGGEGNDLDERDHEALLEHAFRRYFETSALFGTPESCARMLGRLSAIGVDEVGCLIDFGVAVEEVLAMLPLLERTRDRARELARRSLQPAAEPGLGEEIAARGVTHLQCTPSLAAAMLPELGRGAGLRAVMLGGEPMTTALARQVTELTGAELHNMYGPTETTVWSATDRVDPEAATITVGRPIANTALYVLDPDLRPVPVGVPGQLFIGGAGVTRGYLRRPELTAARFVPDPFGGDPGGRLYATGDLARFEPDGRVEWLGRLDQQIKVRGHRIEPAEIELVLREQEGISEAVVVAREEAPGDRRLVAYLVPESRRRGLAPVAPETRRQLLNGQEPHTLANGLVAVHHDSRQLAAVYQEVFEDGVYARHGIAYDDGACIFDLGANVGFFSLFASTICRPGAIYAFEPIPANFELLRANLGLNGARAQAFQMGMAERPGEDEFVFYPRQSGLSNRIGDRAADRAAVFAIAAEHLRGQGLAGIEVSEIAAAVDETLEAQTVACPVTTVSEAVRAHEVERIDLLKVDVEGSEIDVLRGIAEQDWPKIRQAVLEVHSRALLEQVLEILRRQGFEVAVDELIAVDAPAGGEVTNFMVYARRPGVGGGADAAWRLPRAAELRAALAARLPHYMVPERFVFLDELPRTPNGKLDRGALARRRDEGIGRRDSPYVAPASDLERRIAAVWQEVLGGAEPGVHDNFFDVGGNSLLLVKVHQRLHETADRLTLVDLFQHPTIAALARHLGEGGDDQAFVAESARRALKQEAAREQNEALARQRSFMEQRRSQRRVERMGL